MDCCYHNLIALVPSNVTEEEVSSQKRFEGICAEHIADFVSEIIARLPMVKDEDGIWSELAPVRQAAIKLPRSYPLPEQQPLTKWQAFARAKGIVKRKKPKVVFDEAAGDYKWRWGARSLRKAEENREFMLPAKPGQGDPFEAKRTARKLAISKQKLREIKNKTLAAGYRLPSTPRPEKKKSSRGGARWSS